MKLNELNKIKSIKKAKKRGRGYGSGKGGHTTGSGQKGQRSRSGFKKLRSWIRDSKVSSLPKLRGIGKRSSERRYFKGKYEKVVLNMTILNEKFRDGSVVDLGLLKKTLTNCSAKRRVVFKVLGNGEIKKKITLKGIEVSKTAKEKIEKAGGKVI